MRLPRHDTSKSLPGEPPREAIARDEALLDGPVPRAGLVRWWVPSSPAVVVGLGQRRRLAEIVDIERCRQANVDVLERRAGGGALWLDEHVVCGAVCLPRASVPDDVTESYRWLGDRLVARLQAQGVARARRVEVAEARADVAALRSRATLRADGTSRADATLGADATARLLLATCYGDLSPHEVAIGNAKLVGIAQIRRRHAVLFQFGILLRDQSPLADYLQVPTEAMREKLRAALARRTAGLESHGTVDLESLVNDWN